MNRLLVFPLGVIIALNSACAAETFDDATLGDEPVAESEAEIGEASCGNATANAVVRLSINPGVIRPPVSTTSPTTYDHPACDKAWVLDLINSPFDAIQSNIPMEVVYNGPRDSRFPNEIPNVDETTCRNIQMRAIRYRFTLHFDQGRIPFVVDDSTSRASFIPLGGPPAFPGQPQAGVCHVPPPIPLSATPVSAIGEKLTMQVTKPGGVTVSVRLKPR